MHDKPNDPSATNDDHLRGNKQFFQSYRIHYQEALLQQRNNPPNVNFLSFVLVSQANKLCSFISKTLFHCFG